MDILASLPKGMGFTPEMHSTYIDALWTLATTPIPIVDRTCTCAVPQVDSIGILPHTKNVICIRCGDAIGCKNAQDHKTTGSGVDTLIIASDSAAVAVPDADADAAAPSTRAFGDPRNNVETSTNTTRTDKLAKKMAESLEEARSTARRLIRAETRLRRFRGANSNPSLRVQLCIDEFMHAIYRDIRRRKAEEQLFGIYVAQSNADYMRIESERAEQRGRNSLTGEDSDHSSMNTARTVGNRNTVSDNNINNTNGSTNDSNNDVSDERNDGNAANNNREPQHPSIRTRLTPRSVRLTTDALTSPASTLSSLPSSSLPSLSSQPPPSSPLPLSSAARSRTTAGFTDVGIANVDDVGANDNANTDAPVFVPVSAPIRIRAAGSGRTAHGPILVPVAIRTPSSSPPSPSHNPNSILNHNRNHAGSFATRASSTRSSERLAARRASLESMSISAMLHQRSETGTPSSQSTPTTTTRETAPASTGTSSRHSRSAGSARNSVSTMLPDEYFNEVTSRLESAMNRLLSENPAENRESQQRYRRHRAARVGGGSVPSDTRANNTSTRTRASSDAGVAATNVTSNTTNAVAATTLASNNGDFTVPSTTETTANKTTTMTTTAASAKKPTATAQTTMTTTTTKIAPGTQDVSHLTSSMESTSLNNHAVAYTSRTAEMASNPISSSRSWVTSMQLRSDQYHDNLTESGLVPAILDALNSIQRARYQNAVSEELSSMIPKLIDAAFTMGAISAATSLGRAEASPLRRS